MKLLQVPIITQDKPLIDFEALANISIWNFSCWKSAWDTLVGYEKPIDNLDDLWGFLVRLAFKSSIPPTDIADVILEIFDTQ